MRYCEIVGHVVGFGISSAIKAIIIHYPDPIPSSHTRKDQNCPEALDRSSKSIPRQPRRLALPRSHNPETPIRMPIVDHRHLLDVLIAVESHPRIGRLESTLALNLHHLHACAAPSRVLHFRKRIPDAPDERNNSACGLLHELSTHPVDWVDWVEVDGIVAFHGRDELPGLLTIRVEERELLAVVGPRVSEVVGQGVGPD